MYEEALEDYTKALEIEPTHFKSYFNRAFCFDILGSYKKSLEDYFECLKLKPDNVRTLHHIGSVYEKISTNKALKNSVRFFLKALKIDPNYAPSYNGLGLVYDAMNKRDKALRNFDKALLIAPKNAVFLQNKACCLRRMGNLEEGLKYFR